MPVYLISGDEPLLAAEAADAVRARARGAGFTEREVHFIERAADWDVLRASAANLSLFGARRVVEIRLASARAGTAGNAALIALLEARDPDTLFLILTPRLDRDAQGADWVRAVEAHGAWVQIWPVDSHRLVAWLKGRCRRLKLEASDEALELLAARTEQVPLAARRQQLERFIARLELEPAATTLEPRHQPSWIHRPDLHPGAVRLERPHPVGSLRVAIEAWRQNEEQCVRIVRLEQCDQG